jgi:hypothetical protein
VQYICHRLIARIIWPATETVEEALLRVAHSYMWSHALQKLFLLGCESQDHLAML